MAYIDKVMGIDESVVDKVAQLVEQKRRVIQSTRYAKKEKEKKKRKKKSKRREEKDKVTCILIYTYHLFLLLLSFQSPKR